MLDTIPRIFILFILIGYSLLAVALIVWPIRRRPRHRKFLALSVARVRTKVRFVVRQLGKRGAKS